MVKRISFWTAVVIVVFGMHFFLNASVGKVLKEVKQVRYSKPLVEEEKGEKKVIGNLTFKYTKNDKHPRTIGIEGAIDAAISSIHANKKLLSELFGNELMDEPVSIVLVEDPSKLKDVFGPTLDDGHIEGAYVFEKKSIYIRFPEDDSKLSQYTQTIVHEYTHHLINRALINAGLHFSDLPVWFHEGVAAYVQKKNSGTFSEEIKEMEKVSFKELKTNKQWENYLRAPYDPYLQSNVMAGLLVKNEGPDAVNKIIEGTKKNSFNESFAKTTGKSVASYESETFKILKDFPSMIVKARGKLNFDHNPANALQSALELNDLIPNVDEVIILISEIYAEKGDYENSIAYAEQVAHFFPNSSYYLQLANLYLVIDLDKAVEASKLAVNLANSEDKPFYQKHMNNLNTLHESVHSGNPFKGFMTYLNTENLLTDKNKADLINRILENYPLESNGREALLSFKQNLP
ncbi:hypothetical protein D1B31_13850 [Neobacillus notoginsengisoli]|uniref:Uncharacterized protein n=1 Tax=Neobacillus notoginsengisoli TaxID=1578198 RepID=A0A417YST9_9BACI|nr:hypothetical protein [Neobacillus notoginsengisoli]RHW39042.1 hypothetical protein D1B31_13850 [Neobacillus notoginsengisoli]